MRLQELGTKPSTKQINRINESRFGFSIDYKNLTVAKAQRLQAALAENLSKIRRSYGVHTAEKNPKYMEILMVREGIGRWLEENTRRLDESELGKSEAILAAKDIVDTIQDMLEDIGRMQNEQVPALMDTIRDQIGSEQAEAFKASLQPLLQNLYQNIQSAREGADGAARALAGEAPPAGDMSMGGDMGGGMGPDEMGGMAAGEVPGGTPPSDLDTDDGMNATDAAAGGQENLGREPR